MIYWHVHGHFTATNPPMASSLGPVWPYVALRNLPPPPTPALQPAHKALHGSSLLAHSMPGSPHGWTLLTYQDGLKCAFPRQAFLEVRPLPQPLSLLLPQPSLVILCVYLFIVFLSQ